MNCIKLNATGSTNDFLKQLLLERKLENFAVVITDNQLQGKGQRGASWISEPYKNLTFSVLVNNKFDISDIFLMNIIVAISVTQALKEFVNNDLKIKWPNDILADKKKIGGILIENSIKSDGEINSIIGIGLNINQASFENLPNASSLAILNHVDFDKEAILKRIIFHLEQNCNDISNKKYFWETYHNYLFKKDIPSVFVDNLGNQFMGIIKNVDHQGKLNILLEDDSTAAFEVKQISMIY